MKTVLRLLLGTVLVVVLAIAVCYAIGARLPVEHSVSVTGTVAATPDAVFRRIANVRSAPAWRKAVHSVKVLPPVDGGEHWVEDLGYGTKMNFIATSSHPPTSDGIGLRMVKLADPGAAYGGVWTYHILPGPTPSETTLRITEDGYINPPLYRFLMVHLIGMTRNLDQYMKDLQTAANAPQRDAD